MTSDQRRVPEQEATPAVLRAAEGLRDQIAGVLGEHQPDDDNGGYGDRYTYVGCTCGWSDWISDSGDAAWASAYATHQADALAPLMSKRAAPGTTYSMPAPCRSETTVAERTGWAPSDEMVEAAMQAEYEHDLAGMDHPTLAEFPRWTEWCDAEIHDALRDGMRAALAAVGPDIRAQAVRENEALTEARRFAQRAAVTRRLQGAGAEERAWLDLIYLLDLVEKEAESR